jgi:hypothetical protein
MEKRRLNVNLSERRNVDTVEVRGGNSFGTSKETNEAKL